MDKQRLDKILELLWACKLPNMDDTRYLLTLGQQVLIKEANVLELKSPITLCGDIHGQFYDLLELFSVGGHPPEQNFLFLGDYVDRGFYSTETFFLLLALKVRFPTKIFLIRGNHESAQVTQDYGFKEEIKRKYNDESVYDLCLEVFNALPLAAVIDKEVFCVHGGLSKDLHTVSQLNEIDRNAEPPEYGLFSDILWSDPDPTISGFEESQRGAGYLFGGDVTAQFLKNNNLKFMCRAHQVAQDGYVNWFNGLCYTVWSAPNYCYRGGNLATVFEITNSEKTKFKIFREALACARGKQSESMLPQYFV
ncbi:protein phosphatase 4 catalytic subunit, putative [Trichomonas vaginalis G3]|uniref:Serine/threonine-protein phosphatase n=1 Tax=Trichomonas vaginalis (strain ATCC PRA-98 / G3) TaxID=412133 RepID=A2EG46_TRIV3|nr:serine threonine-protein phosphatase family [Trichomonas vaginalis G3]EAY08407.1 protein phosphatase 4 catalytic subunit, putative [Trichomonas vaginalis G3]KAI5499310.1 serine threonine-protein phosphatase family [Trichomonas vaginalis G3]|eukprot:XP_001320630.1 protein phosphatase 4 catalytic subunit [Trichomonas vaginalis G3]